MKQSEKLKKEYSRIRNRIIAEIMYLIMLHEKIEMAVEFPKPIFYGTGVDEQDNPPEIEEITSSGLAIIFYQGSEVERVKLEKVDTDKLLEILKGVEDSYKEVEQFLNKK